MKLIDSFKRIDKKIFLLAAKYLVTLDFAAVGNLLSVFLVRFSAPPRYRPQLFLRDAPPDRKLVFPSFEAPAVSIVIPVFNQWPYTLSCLESVLANTDGVPYEIILADDGSADETRNILDRVSNVRVIRNSVNLRFLKNCNSAARHARGRYLLFLNNDTNVQKDWLRHLVETAEGDAAVGIAGPKLVYPDGRLQEAGGIVWRDGSAWNYGWFDDPEKDAFNFVREVDYISGACLMVRRELWERVGGFDERFAPAYYEDTDLAFACRKAGYKVVYQPKSVVVHFEGKSCGTSLSEGEKRYQEVNREKFAGKWRAELERDHFERGRNLAAASDRKGR